MLALALRRPALAILAVGVLLSLAATPALADTDLATTGVVGVHSLVDTSSKPGATCGYKVVDAADYNFATRLTALTVRPPRMFATDGRQRVGWRFIVRRERWDEERVTYRRTYRSPRQYATASQTRAAVFAPMSVAVFVPRDGRSDYGPLYGYVVRVQMRWYDARGSVVGSSTHEVDWYRSKAPDFPLGGPWVEEERGPCEGWFGWLAN